MFGIPIKTKHKKPQNKWIIIIFGGNGKVESIRVFGDENEYEEEWER